MKYQIPTYEIILDDVDNYLVGVDTISVVENPAMESNFFTLSDVEIKLSKDEDKRVTVGAALIPNKKIYRINEDGTEYYIFFKPETIEKIVENFFKKNHNLSFNIEHSKQPIEAVVIESWIVSDVQLDKQQIYGFNYPIGTWILSAKFSQDDWDNYIKTGVVKGYSIEGNFQLEYAQLSKDEKVLSETEALNLIEAILNDTI